MIEFSGTEIISASIKDVWAYLMDVHKVAACGPGFQSLKELEPEHWELLVSTRVGPIKTKMTLDVMRPEKHEPDHMVIKVHTKTHGSTVEILAEIHLIDLYAVKTRIDWHAKAVVEGMLASVGTRMMNSTAEKLTAQFFTCLKDHLQSPNVSSST
jgi:uncharacterized protein